MAEKKYWPSKKVFTVVPACNSTDDPKIKAEINKTFDVTFCELNDIESVERALNTEEYACAIIEGIQGIGGVYIPSGEFLTALQEVCKKTKTVLILDEIQSGYGRSGKFFAFQHHHSSQRYGQWISYRWRINIT
jgi:acetylornithine/N-succinyldiaminopimelate aminotransferase